MTEIRSEDPIVNTAEVQLLLHIIALDSVSEMSKAFACSVPSSPSRPASTNSSRYFTAHAAHAVTAPAVLPRVHQWSEQRNQHPAPMRGTSSCDWPGETSLWCEYSSLALQQLAASYA